MAYELVECKECGPFYDLELKEMKFMAWKSKTNGTCLEISFDDDARDIYGIGDITKIRDLLTTIINKENGK